MNWPPYYHVPRVNEPQSATGERLPALQELVLDGYGWSHSNWAAVNFWDWSNITHLELRNTQVDRFLRTVPLQYLSGLRNLITDSGAQVDRGVGRDRLLCSLVRQTSCLEELRVKYDVEKSELLSAIARNGSCLRSLELRCLDKYRTSEWSPLSGEDLAEIGSGCPRLMDLTVDMAWPETLSGNPQSETSRRISVSLSPPPITALTIISPLTTNKESHPRPPPPKNPPQSTPPHPLSALRNLRHLKITTRLIHRIEPEDSDITHARTSTAVRAWLTDLVAAKQGAGFEKVTIHVRCKRISAGKGAHAWNAEARFGYEDGVVVEVGRFVCTEFRVAAGREGLE